MAGQGSIEPPRAAAATADFDFPNASHFFFAFFSPKTRSIHPSTHPRGTSKSSDFSKIAEVMWFQRVSRNVCLTENLRLNFEKMARKTGRG